MAKRLQPFCHGYHLKSFIYYTKKRPASRVNNALNTGSYNITRCANDDSWDDVNILDNEEMIQDYRDRFDEINKVSLPITLTESQRTKSDQSTFSIQQQ